MWKSRGWGFSDRDQRLQESLARHCGNVGCLGVSHDSSEAYSRRKVCSLEEAEDAWDTQNRERTHGSTESKPSWVWHVQHERECGRGEQP